MNAVTLLCWECSEPWEQPRRQGQYPLRCPRCTSGEMGAKIVARRARALGLHQARVVNHEHQGWVCVVGTPWHELPVIVRDEHDLRYLQAELAAESTHQIDHRLTRSAA